MSSSSSSPSSPFSSLLNGADAISLYDQDVVKDAEFSEKNLPLSDLNLAHVINTISDNNGASPGDSFGDLMDNTDVNNDSVLDPAVPLSPFTSSLLSSVLDGAGITTTTTSTTDVRHPNSFFQYGQERGHVVVRDDEDDTDEKAGMDLIQSLEAEASNISLALMQGDNQHHQLQHPYFFGGSNINGNNNNSNSEISNYFFQAPQFQSSKSGPLTLKQQAKQQQHQQVVFLNIDKAFWGKFVKKSNNLWPVANYIDVYLHVSMFEGTHSKANTGYVFAGAPSPRFLIFAREDVEIKLEVFAHKSGTDEEESIGANNNNSAESANASSSGATNVTDSDFKLFELEDDAEETAQKSGREVANVLTMEKNQLRVFYFKFKKTSGRGKTETQYSLVFTATKPKAGSNGKLTAQTEVIESRNFRSVTMRSDVKKQVNEQSSSSEYTPLKIERVLRLPKNKPTSATTPAATTKPAVKTSASPSDSSMPSVDGGDEDVPSTYIKIEQSAAPKTIQPSHSLNPIPQAATNKKIKIYNSPTITDSDIGDHLISKSPPVSPSQFLVPPQARTTTTTSSETKINKGSIIDLSADNITRPAAPSAATDTHSNLVFELQTEIEFLKLCGSDDNSRFFWSKYFKNHKKNAAVPFQTFFKCWSHYTQTQYFDVESDISSTEAKALQHLFVSLGQNEKGINLITFSEFLNYFGPFHRSLVKIRTLLQRGGNWFFGKIPPSEIVNKLRDQPTGTFIVALSTSKRCSFILAYKTANGTVQMQENLRNDAINGTLVYEYEPGKWENYFDLLEFVDNHRDFLVYACEGSPYRNVFTEYQTRTSSSSAPSALQESPRGNHRGAETNINNNNNNRTAPPPSHQETQQYASAVPAELSSTAASSAATTSASKDSEQREKLLQILRECREEGFLTDEEEDNMCDLVLADMMVTGSVETNLEEGTAGSSQQQQPQQALSFVSGMLVLYNVYKDNKKDFARKAKRLLQRYQQQQQQ